MQHGNSHAKSARSTCTKKRPVGRRFPLWSQLLISSTGPDVRKKQTVDPFGREGRMKHSVHITCRTVLYIALVGAICVQVLPVSSQTAWARVNSRTINGHIVSGRFLAVWGSRGNE